MATRASVRVKRKRDAEAAAAAVAAEAAFAADTEVAVERSKLQLAKEKERLKAELAEAQDLIRRLRYTVDSISADKRAMGAQNIHLQRQCDKTSQEVTEEVRAQNRKLLAANDDMKAQLMMTGRQLDI